MRLPMSLDLKVILSKAHHMLQTEEGVLSAAVVPVAEAMVDSAEEKVNSFFCAHSKSFMLMNI